ncbi:MAG: Re/Si-specific NAD(P)(+) transhydrogenase subunit alpha [Myxococcales bacterium]|nr:Re/Si-specific NAD(P)(+) transhydrogenase subunit alpha [Myxococcales bacterium]
MKVGIPRESHEGERRVAGTPGTVQQLVKMGFEVVVERDAGAGASLPDAFYAAEGATLVDAATVWGESDLVLKVRPPTLDEVAQLRQGATLISFIWPAQNAALIEALQARDATVLAMDCIPRISRAQKMDALSSMANIAGYRAVIEAAAVYGSFFTGQITAAGKVAPARVLVIGAGVAGLAAIAAARGLGAVVKAFDTRAAVREQVQSLGAQFLELEVEEDGEGGGGYAKVMSEAYIRAEMELFLAEAAETDIVITTALIPGRPAPKLWEQRAVEAMRPGSVVVDMAAEQGGNCDVTVPGEAVQHAGVTIIGYTDLSSRLATTASQLYGTNLLHLLRDMGGSPDAYKVDHEDEVVRGALVLDQGALMWPPPKVEAPPPAAAPKPEVKPAPVAAAPAPATPAAPVKPKKSPVAAIISLALVGLWLFLRFSQGDAMVSPASARFLEHLTVFVLACFVGWQVIWSVTAALHTPLMSVTNAISGIIILGGMLQARGSPGAAAVILGILAVLFATINIAGGFLVTQRMLKMFRR